MFQTIWVLKALALIASVFGAILSPAILMLIYGKIARRGRLVFDFATHDRIERNETIIFFGGYLVLLIAFLFIIAPKAIG